MYEKWVSECIDEKQWRENQLLCIAKHHLRLVLITATQGRFPTILDLFQHLKTGVPSGCLEETSIFKNNTDWWRYFVVKARIYMVSLLDFINSVSYTDNIQYVSARWKSDFSAQRGGGWSDCSDPLGDGPDNIQPVGSRVADSKPCWLLQSMWDCRAWWYGTIRFKIPLDTLQVMSRTILQVRWPNQQCHSTEGQQLGLVNQGNDQSNEAQLTEG